MAEIVMGLDSYGNEYARPTYHVDQHPCVDAPNLAWLTFQLGMFGRLLLTQSKTRSKMLLNQCIYEWRNFVIHACITSCSIDTHLKKKGLLP